MVIHASLDGHGSSFKTDAGNDWIDVSIIGQAPLVGDYIDATDFLSDEDFPNQKMADEFFDSHNVFKVFQRIWGKTEDGQLLLELWCTVPD